MPTRHTVSPFLVRSVAGAVFAAGPPRVEQKKRVRSRDHCDRPMVGNGPLPLPTARTKTGDLSFGLKTTGGAHLVSFSAGMVTQWRQWHSWVAPDNPPEEAVDSVEGLRFEHPTPRTQKGRPTKGNCWIRCTPTCAVPRLIPAIRQGRHRMPRQTPWHQNLSHSESSGAPQSITCLRCVNMQV